MVLVIGDVIDDILARPKAPIRPNTDVESEISISAGGSAANFASWLASLGTQVNFVGRVARSDVEKHSQNLKSFGVTPHLQADDASPTGSIVVLVQGEDRTFLTDRGANKNLDVSKIPDALFDDLLYISGYSLLSLKPEAVSTLIERAHNRGAKVACDPGSAGFIEDFGVKRFLETLAGVDILLPNLEEGRLLSGEDRPELITGFLAERFDTVALTMGPGGCAVQRGDEYVRHDAIPAEIVDSTGAGDAFAAAFLEKLTKSADLSSAATAGVRLGAIAVTLAGGRPKN
jgi:sugar/nucleoside kinase (ribokinase family)